MTPQTPTGWFLFAAMWLAGPVTGYTVANLMTALWERRAAEVREVATASICGSVLVIATLLLMLMDGL